MVPETKANPAKTLYALKVLLRDVRVYYGERIDEEADTTPFDTVFQILALFKARR